MFKKAKEINEKISENVDSEENVEELLKILEEDKHQPVGLVVLESLGLCGPLLWLIYNCTIGAWSKLILNIPLAAIGVILLVVIWRNYFKKRNENKELQKEKNRGTFLLFLLIIIGIVLMIGMFAALSMVQEYIFAEDGWLFCANSNLSIWIMIILGVAIIIAMIFRTKRYQKNSCIRNSFML